MVTLKDISKATGYSTTTISRALNGYSDIGSDTIKKIKGIAQEMGYVANASARSLITRKSWTIGIVFDEITGAGLRHPLFARILESFKKAVEEEGYDVLFIAKQKGKNPIKSYYLHALEKSIDGIFVLCTDYSSNEYQELAVSAIPTIVVDHLSNNIYNVASDNRYGISQVVTYLKELGHTKIAHIHGGDDTFAGSKRKEHFINIMLNNNLDVKGDYLVNGDSFTLENGYEAMNRLLKLDDLPTAVFCAGDMLAIGALKAIKEAKLNCPKDISVVGFDGIEIGELISPGLTTVRQDTKSMGEKSAELLIDIIDGKLENIGKTVYIDTELVVRESSDVKHD